MVFTNSLAGDVLALFITLAILVIGYFKWCYQYWKRRNVPYFEPQIPFGNLTSALTSKEHNGVTIQKIYQKMKRNGWKHGGLYVFTRPNYLPLDLDIVRNILTKDFQYFADRNTFVNHRQPLQAHLLNLKGDEWKSLRSKLSPTFTSGKMKMMFNIMAEFEKDLDRKMDKEIESRRPIDIKEILSCFTTNIIGSCAFGLEFKALEDEDSSFRKIGRNMFKPSKKMIFKRMFAMTFPNLAKLINLKMANKENSTFISNLVSDTIEYREKNNYTRNDFMQMLINLKKYGSVEAGKPGGEPLTFDEVASQALVFFAAGFETSSTLMTFALYELAKHQQIQDNLRNEINKVLANNNNEMTYDAVQEMKYLTQVIDETLRMHPPAATLQRLCVKDYKVPNYDLLIEKGTNVMISLLGIHYDKDYYSNPEEFDPEHFSDENRRNRHNFAHMPFGEGPRNCIGLRFGLLQSKVGLVALLRKYRFTLNQKTKQPLAYKPGSIVLSVEGEVWLNCERI